MRALAIGAAGLTYEQYRAATFKGLLYTITARGDWAALQAGRNPFKTDEDKRQEMAELKALAEAKYGKK